jgi:hypothetical protein
VDLPTKYVRCGVVISLGYDCYSTKGNEYGCEEGLGSFEK